MRRFLTSAPEKSSTEKSSTEKSSTTIPETSGVDMSNAHYAGRATAQQPLRVREQARDALSVLAFSAVTATALALALLLLVKLGGQG